MRSPTFSTLAVSAILILLTGPLSAFGQDERKPPPDEYKALLREVSEAYKAPREVDKDVLDELRKQYGDPKPDREVKIFKEIRRLYVTTPEIEAGILREMRKAYEQPTAEQEERIFQAIRHGGQLPLGTISPDVQAERAAKLFRKLDQDKDGYLTRDEMPDVLRDQLGKWDANRDGAIDFAEYGVYYQAQLKWVSEGVASGEIPLKAAQAMGVRVAEPEQLPTPRAVPDRPAQAKPNLPDWFYKFDIDQDGQVGLYEWKKMGRLTADFLEIDTNNDGFITAAELLSYLARSSTRRPGDSRGR